VLHARPDRVPERQQSDDTATAEHADAFFQQSAAESLLEQFVVKQLFLEPVLEQFLIQQFVLEFLFEQRLVQRRRAEPLFAGTRLPGQPVLDGESQRRGTGIRIPGFNAGKQRGTDRLDRRRPEGWRRRRGAGHG